MSLLRRRKARQEERERGSGPGLRGGGRKRGQELATKEEAEGGGGGGGSTLPPAALPRASGPDGRPLGTAAAGPGPGAQARDLNPFRPADYRGPGRAGSWHLPAGRGGDDPSSRCPAGPGTLVKSHTRLPRRRVGREDRRARPLQVRKVRPRAASVSPQAERGVAAASSGAPASDRQTPGTGSPDGVLQAIVEISFPKRLVQKGS